MPEIKVSQVTEINNPELREIAMRALNTTQLAAKKATTEDGYLYLSWWNGTQRQWAEPGTYRHGICDCS